MGSKSQWNPIAPVDKNGGFLLSGTGRRMCQSLCSNAIAITIFAPIYWGYFFRLKPKVLPLWGNNLVVVWVATKV